MSSVSSSGVLRYWGMEIWSACVDKCMVISVDGQMRGLNAMIGCLGFE